MLRRGRQTLASWTHLVAAQLGAATGEINMARFHLFHLTMNVIKVQAVKRLVQHR